MIIKALKTVHNPGSFSKRLLALFRALLCAGFVACPGIVHAQQATVQAEISASTVSVDESFALTITALGIDAEFDMSSLEVNFDIVGRSSSRALQITNGKRSSTISWVVELAPKATGRFIIPPVYVGGLASQPLEITVTDTPAAVNRQLFVETSADTTTPYVQAQVIFTIRIFQSISVLDGSLSTPNGEGLVVESLGEDRVFQAERDGLRYKVLERRFAVFPQQSGRLRIAPITLTASVPVDPNRVRGFFSPKRQLTRRGPSIELDVRPRPDGLRAAWWLPAAAVTLAGEWSGPTDELHVDQPVTRTLQISAGGVMGTQLPEIEPALIEGASLYSDGQDPTTTASPEGLHSTQVFKWAIIPQRAGELELPEVNVSWFDIFSGEEKMATLPAETLIVLPAVGGPQTGTIEGDPAVTPAATTNEHGIQANIDAQQNMPAEPGNGLAATESVSLAEDRSSSVESAGGLSSQSIYWRWLAILALSGWIATTIGWFVARQRGKSRTVAEVDYATQTESWQILNRRAHSGSAMAGLKTAVKAEDPSKIARAVLNWGEQLWPNDPPRSLASLAMRLDSVPVSGALQQLDAALYRAESSPSPGVFNDLAEELSRAVKARTEKKQLSRHSVPLPGL